MADWRGGLNGDPLPWLLDEEAPGVRHLALRRLLDRGYDDPEVVVARAAAMASDPIAAFLAAQHSEGWWAKPGAGYGPKYASTVWSLVFLDQMGADGADPRIRRGCEYLVSHAQTSNGGFGATAARAAIPPPSTAVHCLNGNLVRALLGFGWLDDERVQRAIDFQAAAITGEGEIRFFKSSIPGPGFRCGANDGLPCAWGATKALLALARVPVDRRSPAIQRAIDEGVEFLLSRDPAAADYPLGYRATKPNGSWFRLGFPSGYVTDVLQVLEALCEAGAAADQRLSHAVEWLLGQQDGNGRWANRYAYEGKLAAPIDRPNDPSRWVTLRACTVLRAVADRGRTAASVSTPSRGEPPPRHGPSEAASAATPPSLLTGRKERES
jgi:hypothetical protein